jgi:hypothetical protein
VRMIESTLDWQIGLPSAAFNCLDDVLALDQMARDYTANSRLISQSS